MDWLEEAFIREGEEFKKRSYDNMISKMRAGDYITFLPYAPDLSEVASTDMDKFIQEIIATTKYLNIKICNFEISDINRENIVTIMQRTINEIIACVIKLSELNKDIIIVGIHKNNTSYNIEMDVYT